MAEPVLQVNGVVFTGLTAYKVDVEPLGNWERNANGILVGDLIAYKAKLNLSFGVLQGQHYQMLLGAMHPFFVSVKYWDPRAAGYATGEFYASARSGTLALVDTDGTRWWKDVAFNLIER